MKRIALLCAAATIGLGGTAVAGEITGPTVMSDAQMDRVVAGDTYLAGLYNYAPNAKYVSMANMLAYADGEGGGYYVMYPGYVGQGWPGPMISQADPTRGQGMITALHGVGSDNGGFMD